MKLISLSTEQAPHIGVPLRFFAVAPAFLILGALMLAMNDGNPFMHLHTPALLAATHSLTLGFITMIILGALQQVLPVVVGNSLPFPRMVACLSHLPLIAGTLLFSGGFLLDRPELLSAAWPTLGLAFAAFICAALFSLARSTVQNASKTAIILSVLALLAAVAIGMLLLYAYSNGGYSTAHTLNFSGLSTAHILLALGGWVLLLIVGVSYQVVPMFQLTPQYSKWLTLGLAPAIFSDLLLQLSLFLLDTPPRWLEFFAVNLFWGLTISFSVATLMLQYHRRRRIPDATLIFFRIGMISLLCVALFALATQTVVNTELLKILAGLIFLIGFAMSLILGMLYKIVPFLIWFHLFSGGSFHSIPNMKEIIPEPWVWRHLWLHLATLAAAIMAPFWMIAAQLLMLCLLLQGVLLGYTLFTAIAIYRRTRRRLEQA
jgi:hypothetical protein